MNEATRSSQKQILTEEDPWVVIFDDGSVYKRMFNTKEDAMDGIMEKFRASSKAIRRSELTEDQLSQLSV